MAHNNTTGKTCSKCQTVKPASTFRVDRSKADGTHPWCGECRKRVSDTTYKKYDAAVWQARRTRLRHARLEGGLCRDCGQAPFIEGHVVCGACSIKRRNGDCARRGNWVRLGLCIACRRPAPEGKKRCSDCVAKSVQVCRENRRTAKEFIFARYGGRCAVCAESALRVLTLDHINGDGAAHRRELRRKRKGTIQPYYEIYLLLKKGKQIDWDIQILCFNCHAKKDLAPWWLRT